MSRGEGVAKELVNLIAVSCRRIIAKKEDKLESEVEKFLLSLRVSFCFNVDFQSQ